VTIFCGGTNPNLMAYRKSSCQRRKSGVQIYWYTTSEFLTFIFLKPNETFSAHMNIDDNQMETNAVIKSDGRVSVYRAMITQITCLLTMDDFPFDQQVSLDEKEFKNVI
jgi:hypothetical protein